MTCVMIDSKADNMEETQYEKNAKQISSSAIVETSGKVKKRKYSEEVGNNTTHSNETEVKEVVEEPLDEPQKSAKSTKTKKETTALGNWEPESHSWLRRGSRDTGTQFHCEPATSALRETG